ncbi:MAG: glutamine-hydrolyzing GMP synthase [Candidatus Rokuibacteriota bacterium]
MNQIVILNAGGQYCHLIARRIRELGVHAVVADIDQPAGAFAGARGIIISGGPASVTEPTSPAVDRGIYGLALPILGICYGHQLLAKDLDGRVSPGIMKEYGHSSFQPADGRLFRGLGTTPLTVWMNHGDTVVEVPPGFAIVGATDDCKVAAMEDAGRSIFGVQFHPEVVHTEHGTEILRAFVFDVCGCAPDWDPRARVDQVVEQIRATAGDRRVFFLISGGVDSTVAFYLCYRALGRDRVLGLYVDTGFMREGDAEAVDYLVREVGPEAIRVADRSADFFTGLAGVTNPEQKRTIIGDTFIAVQEDEFARLGLRDEEWLLGQGTIYPDTIESGGARHSAKIKTHHNRVEKIQALIEQGKVIEPLVEFYKDEVRVLGEQLGLPHEVVYRHPFPGPGLAVRCLCAERVAPVEQPPASPLPAGVRGWIVPVRTVGVQGDERSYAQLLAVEAFADPAEAGAFARRFTNEHKSVNRVAVITFTRRPAGFAGLSIHPATLTRERIALLRAADDIVTRIVRKHGLYDAIWQFPVAMLPLGYEAGGETIILRPVNSRDGMTADFAKLPAAVTDEITARLRRLEGVDAVLYDVTNKPPATIELE